MATQDTAGVALEETASLIAADKVHGTPVLDPAGNRLGTIETIMLDKRSGRVAYAVMAFGGFLGLGERYHPLPWSVLRYDVTQGGYVVALDRARLEGAPSFSSAAEVDWQNRQWAQGVYDYYGARPHWLDVP